MTDEVAKLFGYNSAQEQASASWGWWDRLINGDTNYNNLQIANQNLGFQRENLDYQKALQEEIFNREDTSYERTVNDMRNAGLNPLTMNGVNGAGEAIATTPLHNDMQWQGQKGILDIAMEAFNIANAMQNFQIGVSKAAQERSMATIAENNATKSTKMLDDEIWNSRLDRWQKEMMTEDLWRNTIFNRDYNIFNGMPEINKYINMTKKFSGLDVGRTEIDRIKYNGEYKYGYEYSKPQNMDLEQEIAETMRNAIKTLTDKIDKINNNDWKGFFFGK